MLCKYCVACVKKERERAAVKMLNIIMSLITSLRGRFSPHIRVEGTGGEIPSSQAPSSTEAPSPKLQFRASGHLPPFRAPVPTNMRTKNRGGSHLLALARICSHFGEIFCREALRQQRPTGPGHSPFLAFSVGGVGRSRFQVQSSKLEGRGGETGCRRIGDRTVLRFRRFSPLFGGGAKTERLGEGNGRRKAVSVYRGVGETIGKMQGCGRVLQGYWGESASLSEGVCKDVQALARLCKATQG